MVRDRASRDPNGEAGEGSAATSPRKPRRAVALEGYAVLDDGTTIPISLIDLSYDGCKIRTEIALIAGVRVKLSLLGMAGSVDAVVRWYKTGRAGLLFNPEGTITARAKTPRMHERTPVSAEALLRRAGRRQYVARLFDLTPRGCRIEFVEPPGMGETLWVKFAGLDSLEASVRWIDGFYGGLEFLRPIHPVVFDLLVTRLSA
jgi:hypothetical protein